MGKLFSIQHDERWPDKISFTYLQYHTSHKYGKDIGFASRVQGSGKTIFHFKVHARVSFDPLYNEMKCFIM